MIGKQQYGVLILGVTLVTFLLFLVRNWGELDEQQQPSTKSMVVSEETYEVVEGVAGVAFVEGETVSDLSGHYFKDYGTERQNPQQDLEEVAMVFGDYQTVAGPSHPLPTRGNREIVEFLSGENPSGFRYLSMSGAAVNSSGELVDRWGQPLYFHFESSEEVGIRSAGQDGQMWSDDDVVAATGERLKVASN
ncbi:MAG: hypothetical protein ACSHYB_11875 [Roseibacillus sp.]